MTVVCSLFQESLLTEVEALSPPESTQANEVTKAQKTKIRQSKLVLEMKLLKP